MSQELLPYAGHGWIRIKPNVRELQGRQVVFDDGTAVPCDAIIYATGYRTTLPFLSPDVFSVEDGKPVALYRRIVAPRRPGLYFMGLVQPVGPTIPLVEIQAKWLARLLSGRLHVPSLRAMDAEIDAHHRTIRRTFVGSPRYTLEVDYKAYAGALNRAIAGRGIA